MEWDVGNAARVGCREVEWLLAETGDASRGWLCRWSGIEMVRRSGIKEQGTGIRWNRDVEVMKKREMSLTG